MTSLSPAAQALLETRARIASTSSKRIPQYPRTGSAPLSYSQEMVWLSTQLDKSTTAYNRCAALRISGPLDRSALQLALTEIVARHEVLRSRVVIEDGVPRMDPLPAGIVALPVTDLSSYPTEKRNAAIAELLDAEARRLFDLGSGPLIRAGLLEETSDTCTVYITTHHIASDGWSDAVMFRELYSLYGAFLSGDSSHLPDLPATYRDFAAWQRQNSDTSESDRNVDYWRDRLSGAPVVQELPSDRPRRDMPSMSGGQVSVGIPQHVVIALESIGKQEGATPAMTMLAVFQVWLFRLTGEADSIVGLSLAGRTRAEAEALIGLFNTVLPLRNRMYREMTFRDLLRDVRAGVLETHAHQDISIDRLLDALPSSEGVRHTEIARTVFNFRNMPAFAPSLPGVDVEQLPTFNGGAVADLEMEVVERGSGWECELRYRTDIFDEATVKRLLGHYLTLLDSVATDADGLIGRLPVLTSREREQLLTEFNGPVRVFPRSGGLHELFHAQAAATPSAIAASSDAGQLTYAELNSLSNSFATDLRERGVMQGDRIGICMERSLEMIVSLMAVLKAGAAFVPFDTDYPPDRLTHMLADTRPALLIVDTAGLDLLGGDGVKTLHLSMNYLTQLAVQATAPVLAADSHAVACVLYTSGSTGLPKGVLSTHRGITNNLHAMQEMYTLEREDCMLQQTSLGFDAAAWEIFWPLSVGARTHLAQPGGQRDAEYVVSVVREQNIATVGFAPSMLKLMLDMPAFTQCTHIKRVMSYGEVLSPSLQKTLFERMPFAELHNLYGPTETSVAVTTWKCDPHDVRRSVPVGVPIANAEIYILDGGMEPVPVGIPGEIYIGGVCVSNGYHDRPELTAERFPLHPFRAKNGDRVYRTGDIARFGTDGVIEYVGRRDHQLKIRGLRVELEEIEAALERLPGIAESVVVAQKDDAEEYRLIAYAAVDDSAAAPIELRRALERSLPPQFLPAVIVPLTELPHGPNGKVDRSALPDPSATVVFRPRDADLPQTVLERQIASIWSDLLQLTDIRTSDSFFSLGGHSLLAVRMLQRLADEINCSISLRIFYSDPTIQAITRQVAGNAPHLAPSDMPPLLKVRDAAVGTAPLFYINGQPPGGGRYARKFADYLPADQGLCILPVPIFESPITVEEIATRMIEIIRAEQPSGPYLLGGNCFGATLAFEIAQQLHAAGESVSLVALLHPDARTPMHLGFRAIRRAALLGGIPEEFHFAQFSGPFDYIVRTVKKIWREQRTAEPGHRLDRAREAGRWAGDFISRNARRPFKLWSTLKSRAPREADEQVQDMGLETFLPVPAAAYPACDQTADSELADHTRYMSEAWTSYSPRPYPGRVAIIWPVEGPANPPWNPSALWKRLTPHLDWRLVPGNHWTMLHQHFDDSARALSASLDLARKE
ncbi:MAG TPA: amino acid adenylation domain-containing protein [Gemmatimonadaceae bacterium]|nr:amino acid adenylation domain-containing protein [Gemmatimonadaceae bacterium]